MTSPIVGALERLICGELAHVRASDVFVSGLEVFAGEGRSFGVFPDKSTLDAAADMLGRVLTARDEVDGESTIGELLAQLAEKVRAR